MHVNLPKSQQALNLSGMLLLWPAWFLLLPGLARNFSAALHVMYFRMYHESVQRA